MYYVCVLGFGCKCVAHRVETVSSEEIGIRNSGRRGMRQQKNGTADRDVEARGGSHKFGHVRKRC